MKIESCLEIAKLIEDEIDHVIECGENTEDLFGECPKALEIDGAYILCDNDGAFILTPSQLKIFHGMGFVVHEDVVYHPKKWKPIDFREIDNHELKIYGHDGIVIPKIRKSFL